MSITINYYLLRYERLLLIIKNLNKSDFNMKNTEIENFFFQQLDYWSHCNITMNIFLLINEIIIIAIIYIYIHQLLVYIYIYPKMYKFIILL